MESAVQTFAAQDSIHLTATWNANSGLKLAVNNVKTTASVTWTAQPLSVIPAEAGISFGGLSGNDADTKLLIHSDSTDGNTTFTDSSSTGHTVTANGNVHHETDAQKFGDTAMYFDGTGDYLSIPDSDDWEFGNGDFTVDTWIKTTDTNGFV